MATCHQCNSEISDADAFCPYCGISLVPVEIPSEEDEFASTIMMTPEMASKSPSGAPSSENLAPKPIEAQPIPVEEPVESTESVEVVETPKPQESFEVEPEPQESFGQDEQPTVEEIPYHASENVDVPTPSLLEDFEEPAKAEEPMPEAVAEEPVPVIQEDKKEPATEEDIDFGNARTEYSFQVPAYEAPVVASEPASEPEPDSASEPTYSEPNVEAAPQIWPELEPRRELEIQSGSAPSQSEPEPTPEATNDVISKPAEVLNMPDPTAGPAMFDSVRIMDGRMTPTGVRPSDPSPTSLTPETPSSATGSVGGSSRIGGVDTDGRRGAKLKPLEEGIILNNRYEIVRKIGGGGMGAVYLASDNNLGGVLRAVKEMVQAHIEEEQQAKAIEDFKRESMILSQLDHPSIPTIYDYFFDEDEGRFYLAMKYISGGDLSARLRAAPEGKLDEKTVTEWGIQIADVLDYLHNQPTTIVYRDLKPSNIMIDGNSGRVMLIDFGIARSINQKEEKGVTAVGTMGYAPPELFSGNVEPRSDIYSLGSTMFHLLTGADPQSNPLLIFDFQKNPRPRQINSQLSDQMERFIMRSVEYNAASRFESAAEVRAVLTEHLANLNQGMITYGVKAAPESVSLANQPVFCGFCGQRIVATDLFCAFCGSKQPIAQKGVHSEIYGRGATTAKLLVEGTSELQSPIFSLDKEEILIGRRDPMSNIFPEVDLSKYDPQTKISRRHARIWREGNTFLVEDLGSSNGTMLVPIVHDSFRLSPRQPHALTNGDKIRVGDTTLHFVVS